MLSAAPSQHSGGRGRRMAASPRPASATQQGAVSESQRPLPPAAAVLLCPLLASALSPGTGCWLWGSSSWPSLRFHRGSFLNFCVAACAARSPSLPPDAWLQSLSLVCVHHASTVRPPASVLPWLARAPSSCGPLPPLPPLTPGPSNKALSPLPVAALRFCSLFTLWDSRLRRPCGTEARVSRVLHLPFRSQGASLFLGRPHT